MFQLIKQVLYQFLRYEVKMSLVANYAYMPDQARSKVFTTGQARGNPEHYAIKRVGGR